MSDVRPMHRRLSRTLVSGALALLAAGAAAPTASAQSVYYAPRGYYDEPVLISPRAVAYRLQDRGFSEIGRPRFDGTAYIVDATNPAGARIRLFVDARDGVVLGRQRLDSSYYPSGRPSRAGYGWTEEDDQPHRSARASDHLIPPGNIPEVGPTPRRPSSLEANAGIDGAYRPGSAEPSASGLNPDAKAHTVPAPRKTARLSPPQKPVATRSAPTAPTPKPDAAETTMPAAAPETTAALTPAKAEPATPKPVPTELAAPETKPVAGAPKSEKPVAAAPKAEMGWQEPPADEAKRKVRVIDGATVVPGAGETPAANNN